ncbi:MAG: hypothetical protein ACOCUO_00885 [archaeon]
MSERQTVVEVEFLNGGSETRVLDPGETAAVKSDSPVLVTVKAGVEAEGGGSA